MYSVYLCRTDTTPTGYAMGKPENRGTNPFPERKLSPASCAILRFLMHAALMWASSIEVICVIASSLLMSPRMNSWKYVVLGNSQEVASIGQD